MIDIAISHSLVEEGIEVLKYLNTNIQLALYQYDLVKQKYEEIVKNLSGTDKVKVVHLPLQTLKIPIQEIYQIIRGLFVKTGCRYYVVHPNRGIEVFLNKFEELPVMICVETFPWRSKKVLRSPLEIVNACQTYKNTWMTIDTSHIEEIWFDYRIMSYLLKFTKVIHLSNRSKKFGQHLPFNHPSGELNLVKFVQDLKFRYKWNGVIVLEYMEEYRDKLTKNYNYVQRLVKDK